MKQPKIHEFDPVIYPIRIWAGVNTPFDDADNKFYGLNSDLERIPLDRDQYETDSFVVARTHTVTDKKSGWIGLFVNICKPKIMTTKFICHESAHCADFVCENFGIERGGFDNGEAYAYLIGWIAECIEKVKRNKV